MARERLLTVPVRTLWLGVGVGAGLALLTFVMARGFPDFVDRPSVMVWMVCREFLVDAAIFGVVAWAVVVARRLSRLAQDRAKIRLLDPAAFVPFVEHSTRLALLWLIMWSLQVPWLFFLPPEPVGSAVLDS